MAERKIVHTLPLKAPVRFGQEIIEQLEFERIRAEHVWNLSMKPAVGDLFEIGARLAAQPASVIKQLELSDAAEVLKWLMAELRPFEVIGELLSEP